jgi:hypothetical protein
MAKTTATDAVMRASMAFPYLAPETLHKRARALFDVAAQCCRALPCSEHVEMLTVTANALRLVDGVYSACDHAQVVSAVDMLKHAAGRVAVAVRAMGLDS